MTEPSRFREGSTTCPRLLKHQIEQSAEPRSGLSNALQALSLRQLSIVFLILEPLRLVGRQSSGTWASDSINVVLGDFLALRSPLLNFFLQVGKSEGCWLNCVLGRMLQKPINTSIAEVTDRIPVGVKIDRRKALVFLVRVLLREKVIPTAVAFGVLLVKNSHAVKRLMQVTDQVAELGDTGGSRMVRNVWIARQLGNLHDRRFNILHRKRRRNDSVVNDAVIDVVPSRPIHPSSANVVRPDRCVFDIGVEQVRSALNDPRRVLVVRKWNDEGILWRISPRQVLQKAVQSLSFVSKSLQSQPANRLVS